MCTYLLQWLLRLDATIKLYNLSVDVQGTALNERLAIGAKVFIAKSRLLHRVIFATLRRLIL